VTTRAVTSGPLVGGAEADAHLGGKGLERLTTINVLTQQSFPAEWYQPGVRVGMHGG